MDVELLSRIQFAFTVAFHYLFPPLSIGLGLALVFMEAQWLRTGDEKFLAMTKFWMKIFGLLHPYALLTGVTTVALFVMHGSIYWVFRGKTRLTETSY